MILSERSMARLQGVHPKLVALVQRAAGMCPLTGDVGMIVTEGLRTVQRQEQLVAAGASRTMRSRHLTGHAVDLAATVAGQVRWDWALYGTLNGAMQQAAREAGVRLVWGGDWVRFKDGPHWELNPEEHPWQT